MSKKKLIGLATIFNVIMIVAFVFSNIYIWNFINKISSQKHYGSDGVTIPVIGIDALQITGSTIGWTSDGTQEPRPLPTVIPNYPFYIFWIVIVGNLALIVLILRKQIT